MSQYLLRDLPPSVWKDARERAQRDGWPMRSLLQQLLDDYAAGRISPSVAGPGPARVSADQELIVALPEKLAPTIARIEREMIRVALRAHPRRVDQAAKALGISRKGLYLKRQRLGL